MKRNAKRHDTSISLWDGTTRDFERVVTREDCHAPRPAACVMPSSVSTELSSVPWIRPSALNVVSP
jgi:hypothetical protein